MSHLPVTFVMFRVRVQWTPIHSLCSKFGRGRIHCNTLIALLLSSTINFFNSCPTSFSNSEVVIREAPEVVMKGGRVVIVVEEEAILLVVAAKKAEVLDVDPRVL